MAAVGFRLKSRGSSFALSFVDSPALQLCRSRATKFSRRGDHNRSARVRARQMVAESPAQSEHFVSKGCAAVQTRRGGNECALSPRALMLDGGAHRARGYKTGAAIDGTPLGRIEGYRRLLVTSGAGYGHFDFLFNACGLRGRDGGQAVVLRLLAGFAALGLVL